MCYVASTFVIHNQALNLYNKILYSKTYESIDLVICIVCKHIKSSKLYPIFDLLICISSWLLIQIENVIFTISQKKSLLSILIILFIFIYSPFSIFVFGYRIPHYHIQMIVFEHNSPLYLNWTSSAVMVFHALCRQAF